MSDRIRVTGYYTPTDDEADPASRTGLTDEAYLDLIADEYDMGLKVAGLEDLEVEIE